MYRAVNKPVKNDFLVKFGNNLTKLREEKNLSQSQLAERCHTYERKIRRTENGEYSFQITTLIALALGLEVSMSELLNFDYPKNLYENFWVEDEAFQTKI